MIRTRSRSDTERHGDGGSRFTSARWRTGALIALLIASLCGCKKSGLERVPVSGKASYNGQPIVMGQIRFSPVPPSTGPITVELVRDGAYETVASGGVPVGTHRVELRMFDPEDYRTASRAPGFDSVKQLLPERFNRKSELTLTIEPDSDAVEHDFLLTDK